MIVTAPGKVILFGEHAVVYDQLGIASAVNLFVNLKADDANQTTVKDGEISFKVDRNELEEIKLEVDGLIAERNYNILKELSTDRAFCLKNVFGHCIDENDYRIVIECGIPESAGLGSGSAIFASLGAVYSDDLEEIRKISYLGDIVAHGGTPSGIDNSAVVYGNYLSFKKSDGLKRLTLRSEPLIVIGHTGVKASTAKTVGYVRDNIDRFMPDIKRIGEVSKKGLVALEKNDLVMLGKLMNENQELLEKIEVSHPKLEELIGIARANGALGAKLSGKGGGGVMIALCKNQSDQAKIKSAFEQAGHKAYSARLGAKGLTKKK